MDETNMPSDKKVDFPGAMYIYCVAGRGGTDWRPGKIGLEGNKVYTVGYRDLIAVVGDGPAESGGLENKTLAREWVLAHHNVVEEAMQRFGAVLPLGFGKIISGSGDKGAGAKVSAWIKESYDGFKARLKEVEGKAEYGVQVLWDTSVVTEMVLAQAPHIVRLRQEASGRSPGAAFMYGESFKQAVKKELEARAEMYFRDFYGRISALACAVKVDRLSPLSGVRQMILNLSCLLEKEQVKPFGDVLEGIKDEKTFFVRFTGPWPPYSFV